MKDLETIQNVVAYFKQGLLSISLLLTMSRSSRIAEHILRHKSLMMTDLHCCFLH